GISENTNNAGTSQTIASEEKDEEVELIIVPSAVRIPEEKEESRTSSTNSKKEDSSTDSLEDNPKIQAFRRKEGVITDFNSLPTEIEVSPTPTLRIHSIYPKSQILGDPKSAVQNRSIRA
ncbi:hypothetical protein Tco_0181887, partial [Tanacetum coccineum]